MCLSQSVYRPCVELWSLLWSLPLDYFRCVLAPLTVMLALHGIANKRTLSVASVHVYEEWKDPDVHLNGSLALTWA